MQKGYKKVILVSSFPRSLTKLATSIPICWLWLVREFSSTPFCKLCQSIICFTATSLFVFWRRLRNLVDIYFGAAGVDRKGIHWFAWDQCCISTAKGGLEFWKLKVFRKALLAKHLTRSWMSADTLWVWFVAAKYQVSNDWKSWNSTSLKSASPLFKLIWQHG